VHLRTVHTTPWPHCPNENVFSDRLNWPYDSPHSLRLGGRVFQTCGPAAAMVPSPKLLHVRLTTSVRVSAERGCLTRGVGDERTVVGQVIRASLGSRPRLAGSLCQVIAAYALRLNSPAGTEGSSVSSLICDRWLMLGLETLSISRCLNTDNRWPPAVCAGRSSMALFTRTAKLDSVAHGARCA